MSVSNSATAASERGRRPGRPTGRDRGKHDALLSSAKRLFLAQPYQKVTTRELAAAAGVDMALIGYYFGSKQGLYQAMLGDIYERALRDMQQLAREPLPESISELFEMVYRLYSAQPELAVLVFKTLVLGEGPSREFLLREVVMQLRSYVVRVFDKLSAAGVIDSQLDTELLQEAFAGLCFRPFQMRGVWVERQGEGETDQFIRRLYEQNMALFERAVKPV
jgi:AcrR family transcriptional regulator